MGEGGRAGAHTRKRSFVHSLTIEFYRQWNRDATPRSVVITLLTLSIFCFIFNYLGIFDHVFEQGYEKFRWPYSHVDVAKQVALLKSGKKVDYLPVYTHNFRFILSPDDARSVCTVKKSHLILLMVQSRPSNENKRQFVRRWWKDQLEFVRENGEFNFALYFLTGTPLDDQTTQLLKTESRLHGDLIQTDVIDDESPLGNETLVVVSGWKWYHDVCYGTPAYVLMISDHYRVSLGNLVQFINQKVLPEDRQLYCGYLHPKVKVVRHGFGSKLLSLSEYPFSHFPPYIDSGSVLLSKSTLELLYSGSQYVKPFKFSKIYLGILAKLLNVSAKHSDRFVPSRIDRIPNERTSEYDHFDQDSSTWKELVAFPDFE